MLTRFSARNLNIFLPRILSFSEVMRKFRLSSIMKCSLVFALVGMSLHPVITVANAQNGEYINIREKGTDGRKGGNAVIGGNPSPGEHGSDSKTINHNLQTTTPVNSIRLETVGGKGGDGGSADNIANAYGAIGGWGGNAGDITLVNANDFTTENYGIWVAATGGRGGNGGNAGAVAETAGGAGNHGGSGGTVSVTNTGRITITGQFFSNVGIYAASLGGVGGEGGSSGSLGHSSGGHAGSSLGGGTVSIDNKVGGSITLEVSNAKGLFAEVLGGAGGDANQSGAYLGVAEGGNGGDGSHSGSIHIDNAATIHARGESSYGIYAKNWSGDGGDGSAAYAGIYGDNQNTGIGGAGGDIGGTTINNNQNIIMSGINSTGIYASVIAGDGGAGGYAGAGFSAASGKGGRGGYGGYVRITNNGEIYMSQNRSYGIQAEVSGGRGGNGGVAGSAGGAAAGAGGDGLFPPNTYVTNNGNITITQHSSYGISISEYGGHGGKGGDAGSVVAAKSGSGGNGGSAGNSTIVNQGNIKTSGSGSHAVNITAYGGVGGQSGGVGSAGIAGGGRGGNGGGGGDLAISNSGLIETDGTGSYGIKVSLQNGPGGNGGTAGSGIGSDSGSGGHGGGDGSITIDNSGTINTETNNSRGIEALAFGGNGGNGGVAGSGIGAGAGSGGSAGAGATIEIINTGDIETKGEGGSAIYTYSQGGTGGRGGVAGSAVGAVSGSGGLGGAGGATYIYNEGLVKTSGTASWGITALSYAGNGGDGGEAGSGVAAIAGSGGIGGRGQDITIDNFGSIITTGQESVGLYVATHGGDGGKGGIAGSGATSISGMGNVGGRSGNVLIDNGSYIGTSGDRSAGIYAVAEGGSGGDGGLAAAIGGAGAGNGGNGGSAGNLTVTSSGSINTSGSSSSGIQVISIAGDGGQSGGAASGITGGSGHGGYGGYNGSITVANTGQITTYGNSSSGIDIYSLAGDGGNSGFVANLGLAVTGNAGWGGNASNLEVYSINSIYTSGKEAYAIKAVSKGGMGGVAGFAGSGLVSVSQNGGTGGHSGAITISDSAGTNLTTVMNTSGDSSHVVFAESAGGNGGNGGSTLGVHLTGVGVSNSGSGGPGGDGNTINVNFLDTESSIFSSGNNSSGISARSTAGSGGKGGDINSVGVSLSFLSAVVGVSGDGGAGGSGGAIDISNSAQIRTVGENSHGVDVFSSGSVGGRGGDGHIVSISADLLKPSLVSGSAAVGLSGAGGSGGAGNNITVTQNGNITTMGHGSTGIRAESQGGDGGNGGEIISVATSITLSGKNGALAFSKAGDGGAGGNSGSVSIANNAEIVTKGAYADGISAKSLAGNGGSGGLSVAAALAVNLDASSILSDLSKSQAAAIALAFSGNGGDGGSAQSITVSNNGVIGITNSISHGITAQGFGGQGGDGNIAVAASVANTAALSGAIQGQGGRGGHGSQISVFNNGIITSTAMGSGILAESKGGAGGATDITLSASVTSGFTLNFDVPAVAGSGGDGKDVYVENYGGIYMQKTFPAPGIEALSTGGAGGGGGTNSAAAVFAANTVNVAVGSGGGYGGAAGNIEVFNSAEVSAGGALASGIRGYSHAGAGGSGGDVFTIGAMTDRAVNVSIAGSGGNGGIAGEISYYNDGSIYMDGENSIAINALSKGGDGGAAGMAVAAGAGKIQFGAPTGAVPDLGTINSGDVGRGQVLWNGIKELAKNGPVQASVAVGKQGGHGSDGNTVAIMNGFGITNNNQPVYIYTNGTAAHGLRGASEGGQGGYGGEALAVAVEGFSFSGNYRNFNPLKVPFGTTDGRPSTRVSGSPKNNQFYDPKSLNVAVAFSGDGGSGGNSGNVDIQNLGGRIITAGEGAHGIYLSSNAGHAGDGAHAGFGKKVWGNGFYGLNLNLEGEGVLDFDEEAVVGFGGAYATGTGMSSGGLGLSKGGNGGHGGNSGELFAKNSGEIVSEGSGILAQAIGGNGGAGGIANAGAVAVAADTSASVGLAFGGDGGNGGIGGKIEIDNMGNIHTSGTHAAGVMAVSAGGDGGKGNTARAFYLQRNQEQKKTVAEGIKVKNSVFNTVQKATPSSYNIFNNLIKNQQPGKNIDSYETSQYGFEMTLGLGGYGGGGGVANVVKVTNSGLVFTEGDYSGGLHAVSQGGNGGKGGSSGRGIGALWALYEVESLSPFWLTATNPKIDIGGYGGTGGSGNTVTVSNEGTIYTAGNYSTGMSSISTGGNGGAGGTGDSGYIGDVSVGGIGSHGGNGGIVYAYNKRSEGQIEFPLIVTEGDISHGIVASSAGGDGGDGGAARFGGDWSIVQDAINSGRVKGNIKDAAMKFRDKMGLPRLGLAVSGNGGNGGSGSIIIINSEGILSTSGVSSHGILAQSTGGNGGIGGEEYLTNYGKLSGSMLLGILDGTINSGDDEFVKEITAEFPNQAVLEGPSLVEGVDLTSYLGSGGKGGNGGYISITQNGNIYATGNGSHGIVAQSIGGRHGENGKAVYAIISPIGEILNKDWHSSNAADGNGDTIWMTGEGLIFVGSDGNSEASIGILAQSISGASRTMKTFKEEDPNGDGNKNDDIDLNGDGLIQDFEIATGARITSGPGTGTGGRIDILRSGAILSPYGDGIGVLLESSGQQGGGDISFSFYQGSDEIKFPGSYEDYNGFIMGGTDEKAAGILIRGGAINEITLGEGTTVVSGSGRAIIAEDSFDGMNVIGHDTINNSGTVIGSVNLGQGNNRFNNRHRAKFFPGAEVNLGSGGTLNNDGLINPYGEALNTTTGGMGYTTITGSYQSSEASEITLDVGVYHLRRDTDGDTTPAAGGNTRSIYPNVITPGLPVQNIEYQNALYSNHESDQIRFTGDAVLRGTLNVNLQQLSSSGEQVLLSFDRTVDHQGFNIDKSVISVNQDLANVDLVWRDKAGGGTELVAVVSNIQLARLAAPQMASLQAAPQQQGINQLAVPQMASLKMAPAQQSTLPPAQQQTTNQNLLSVTTHLDETVNDSKTGAADGLSYELASLVSVSEGKVHLAAEALDTFHSEPYLSQLTSTLFSDLGFVDKISRCNDLDRKSFITNGKCIWGQASIRYFEKGKSYTSFGIDEESHTFAGGYQRAISEKVIAGMAIQYEQGELEVDDRLSSNFKAGKIGGFATVKEGPFELTLGVNYGYSWYDNKRSLKVLRDVFDEDGNLDQGLVSTSTKGKSAVQSGGLQLQVAYKHETKQFYIKPFIDFRANYLEFDKFSEKGLNGLDLQLKDSDNWQLSIRPGVEFGGKFDLGDGITVRPHLMLGAIFFDDSKLSSRASFAGSPGDIAGFNINSEFDDILATVEAGIDMRFEKQGMNLKLQYGGKFSDDVEEHTGMVRFSVDF